MKVILLGNNSKEEIEKRLQIVTSAGLLSRSEGTVTQVFENNQDYEKNLRIAKNIVGYGHKAIAEHDYVIFALENVTPIIEQIIIGYRLTSFTIKSRRNVDFRNAGYRKLDFKNNNNEIVSNNDLLKREYNNHMQYIFNEYSGLIDEELPVEDCRYVLPYSYFSNIIMGCDANEFLRMTADMLYGKNSSIAEVHEIGLYFKKIIEEKIPYLYGALEKEKERLYYEDQFKFLEDIPEIKKISQIELLKSPNMTNFTNNADWIVLCNILMVRYQISFEKATELLNRLIKEDKDIPNKLMQGLLKSKNQRELEQVIFSFEFPISLAVLTHITRHRMHSLLVPDFVPLWDLENYVIPESIRKNHYDDYKRIFEKNKNMRDFFKSQGVRDEDLVYFYLSGNACNIYTTMNARALEWISRMRCCNKAQREIRDIIKNLVSQVKDVAPLIGTCLGPTCTIEGYCPEGKDSCKNRGVVVKKLENKNIEESK